MISLLLNVNKCKDIEDPFHDCLACELLWFPSRKTTLRWSSIKKLVRYGGNFDALDVTSY